MSPDPLHEQPTETIPVLSADPGPDRKRPWASVVLGFLTLVALVTAGGAVATAMSARSEADALERSVAEQAEALEELRGQGDDDGVGALRTKVEQLRLDIGDLRVGMEAATKEARAARASATAANDRLKTVCDRETVTSTIANLNGQAQGSGATYYYDLSSVLSAACRPFQEGGE